ncbi:kinase-like domain-containing protein [Mycena crocata]|nr:kinase-like domain-containing protein [Mycena crocata]
MMLRSMYPRSRIRVLPWGQLGRRMNSMTDNKMRNSKFHGPHNEEPLTGYEDAGYCPISLGQNLSDRYIVLRKLGWGGCSTVWLARDADLERHVAIKVLTGHFSAAIDMHELEFMQRLGSNNINIVHLLDHFTADSPNGPHKCLVMEPVGLNVSALSSKYRRRCMPLGRVKKITRDTLRALDYLDSCGIIHADIKPNNIFLALDNPEFVVRNYLSTTDPVIYPETQIANENISISQVLTQPLPLPQDTDLLRLDGARFKLGDFGVGFWASEPPQYQGTEIQSTSFRSPEILLGTPWNSKIDIWSVGCMVYELLAGSPLFPPNGYPAMNLKIMALRLLEDPPAFMMESGLHKVKLIGGSFDDTPRPFHTFAENTRRRDDDEDAHQKIISFFHTVFKYDPDQRPSARELLAHPWLVE